MPTLKIPGHGRRSRRTANNSRLACDTKRDPVSKKQNKTKRILYSLDHRRPGTKRQQQVFKRTSLLCKNSPGRGKANDGFSVLSTEPVWPRVNILIVKVAGQNKEQKLRGQFKD